MPGDWAGLDKLIDKPSKCPLPASSFYAIAALDLGCSYINFTPSLGATPAGDRRIGHAPAATRHMGYDGKTGETLLKSTLAPMFAHRNLEVMSWVGHNIFGNMDGKVLDDPANKKSKVTSKDRLLRQIFGYSPQTLVRIEYIASMGDWKTAWDHIHFRGFLGTPMTLQFIWQGLRFAAGGAVGARPGSLYGARLASRRRGNAHLPRQLFQEPLGRRRPRLRPTVSNP